MQTFFSERHRLHSPEFELSGGLFVTPYERPARVESILRRLEARGFDAPREPGIAERGPIEAIHDAVYLDFLELAHADWKAAGRRGEVIAASLPARGMHTDRLPRSIDGRVAFHAHGSDTAITAGTWEAVLSSAASAQAAQRAVAAGERCAFALCRPPGHHATRDQFGGYCFVNNAAMVAQMFVANETRAAVLDIDFHHGNGTQSIFYGRGDVFVASLHGDPRDAYPFFLGYADEVGVGEGVGTNLNLPLPPGTDWVRWGAALETALGAIRAHGSEALVVSLGVDAYESDPISTFRLTSDDFARAGARIATLGLPTVFVMEGGYAIDAVGVNTVNVLEAFLGGGVSRG